MQTAVLRTFSTSLGGHFAKMNPADILLKFCLSWKRDWKTTPCWLWRWGGGLGRSQTRNPIPLLIWPCPLSTTVLYTCSIPVDPFVKFLSSCPLSPSYFPFSARPRMFFKDRRPQVSGCRSFIVWSKFVSFNHPFLKKEPLLLFFFFLRDTRGYVFLTELKRVRFYSLGQLQNVLQRTFPFTKSDLYNSHCSCFPRDCVDKRHFSFNTQPENKSVCFPPSYF